MSIDKGTAANLALESIPAGTPIVVIAPAPTFVSRHDSDGLDKAIAATVELQSWRSESVTRQLWEELQLRSDIPFCLDCADFHNENEECSAVYVNGVWT